MPPFYLITVRKIMIDASIGIFEEEKRARQPLEISVILLIHERHQGELTMEQVVDYGMVHREVTRLIDERHWDLQENLCEAIAQACLEHNEDVLGAVVSTAKTAVYDDVDAVGCSIGRLKPEAADFPWWTLNV